MNNKQATLLSFVALMLIVFTTITTIASSGHGQNTEWVPFWVEDFDSFNTSRWTNINGDGCPNLCGWGNGEKEYYTSESSIARDGMLTITATLTDRWYSGKIATQGKFYFKYGRVDARIRLPVQSGAFPAFWLLPEFNVYGGWPASGEIDAVEFQSKWNQDRHGPGTPGSLHFEEHHGDHAISFWCDKNVVPQNWNTYSVIWEPDYIAFLLNNVEYGRYNKPNGADWKNWPYDQEFYLIVNLAIYPFWGSAPDPSVTKMTMDVDWITISRNSSRIA